MLRLATLTLLLTACAGDPQAPASLPLELAGSAYEAAAEVALEERAALNWPDLENVFHLSDQIYSGGEPLSEEAFSRLAGWGVRTIISVDGKAPNHALAAAHRIHTVHIPTQYRGLSPERMLLLVKSFRELEGPFYVHCFHGRHRGPAAAAIGRVVLNGTPRSQALAEMRQWCGTSPAYEGLFECVATSQIPSPTATAAHPVTSPEAKPQSLSSWMATITRPFEFLEGRASSQFSPDPSHPDLDPVEEARRVSLGLEACLKLAKGQTAAPEYYQQMESALASSRKLLAALMAENPTGAGSALEELTRDCKGCHQAYRNR